MYLACGIITALFARERQGFGQAVYTSLFRNGIWSQAADTMRVIATEPHINPSRRYHETADNAIANYYKTKDDRYILIYHMQADYYWETVCKALGIEDLINDPRFNSIPARADNCVELVKILDEIFIKKTLDEWLKHFSKYKLIYSPVQTPLEAYNDPQSKANNHYLTFDHPTFGPIELCPAPIEFTETPPTYRTVAPFLGQHTEEVLLDLGFSWDDIGQLKDKHVIM
jgi:crotonobetainyl-CoA:carnitine CoA-transferase CaiB-like acyl-CoA transferase